MNDNRILDNQETLTFMIYDTYGINFRFVIFTFLSCKSCLLDPSTTLRACFSGKKHDLKKQSQFAGRQIGTNPYLKGAYGKKPLCGIRKNKAKQSQILLKR